MENSIKIFKNEEFGSIRTLEINGEAWFVGKDVAEILGYSEPRSAVSKKVDLEDRGVAEMETPSGKQNMTIINETGLYSLVLSSKLPSAKKFQRWIKKEVIPSILRTGMYISPQMIDFSTAVDNSPEAIMKMVKNLNFVTEKWYEATQQVKVLKNTVAEQDAELVEARPKVSYYDMILDNPETIPVTLIAKDYGYSAQAFNKLLEDLVIQYQKGKVWYLYQQYANEGYAQSSTVCLSNGKCVTYTKWTQKGRKFLYDILKQNGILPVIEREVA